MAPAPGASGSRGAASEAEPSSPKEEGLRGTTRIFPPRTETVQVHAGALSFDLVRSVTEGDYLDMANNAKANPAAGTAANENYAREVMQLFSMGDVLLNQDGTVQVDATGAPVPAYLQPTVAELARVFTGWTYAPVQSGGQPNWGAYINSSGPMVNYDPMHDLPLF